jgi:hypothetical protein
MRRLAARAGGDLGCRRCRQEAAMLLLRPCLALLAALATAVAAQEATLSAPPEAAAGSRIEVHWTGPGTGGDVIGLGPAGSGSYDTYAPVEWGSPAVLQVPSLPGALRHPLRSHGSGDRRRRDPFHRCLCPGHPAPSRRPGRRRRPRRASPSTPPLRSPPAASSMSCGPGRPTTTTSSPSRGRARRRRTGPTTP